MKTPLFVLLAMLIVSYAHGHDNDSLQRKKFYDEFVRNHRAEYEKVQPARTSLLNTAMSTFSPARAMLIAPAIYMSSDDRAFRSYIDTTMERYLKDQYLQVSCHHYEKEMLPILAAYSTGVCDYVSSKLSGQGEQLLQMNDKKLEEILSQASLAQAKSDAFKAKAAQMRTDYGQDMILHSLGCSSDYIWMGCDYMRRALIQYSITKILETRTEYIRQEEQRFYAALDTAAINGNYDLLKQYYNSGTGTKPYKSTLKVRNEISRISDNAAKLPGKAEVYSVATSKDGYSHILYRSKAGKAGVLGGLRVQSTWIEGKRIIQTIKYIPAKKIKIDAE